MSLFFLFGQTLLFVCVFSKYIVQEPKYKTLEGYPKQSLGNFINSGTPDGVTLSFDCAGRKYAYEYGMQIQPRHGSFAALFDSLQLQACNMTRPSDDDTKAYVPPVYPSSPTNGKHTKNKNKNKECVFYVNPETGSDSSTAESSLDALLLGLKLGTTADAPFATIARAITATRTLKKNAQSANTHHRALPKTECVINLMEGVYYQSDTLFLNASDSYLTIQNYAGANAVISGGVPLTFSNDWQSYKYAPTQWQNLTNWNNVWGRAADPETSNDLVRYLGTVNSYDACVAAATAQSAANGPFHSVTWHGPDFEGWEKQCFGVRDFSWQPVQDEGVFCGRLSGLNIWSRKVSNPHAFGNFMYGLRVNDQRAIRARYPDQIPETGMQYSPLSGWIQAGAQWNGPHHVSNAVDVKSDASDWPGVEWPMDGPGGTPWTGEGDWGQFWVGNGGPCATGNQLAGVDPPYGYWCSHDAPRQITQHECPSAVYLDPGFMPNAPYFDVSDAVVQAWRPDHWYTWMWTAGAYNPRTNELQFAAGGFQGGEGETSGAEWYIENVFEELTMATEYFYNRSTETLYYFHNSTSRTAPPASMTFVATHNNMLYNVTGTQDNPVMNTTYQGLTMRDTRYTYMDPHGLPSGGDWALQRQGAVFLQGTENTLITNNLFTRLDGIGVFVSGYNRNTQITSNDFEWIGDSAMAGWGFTSGSDALPGGGPDGRDGNQPRFTHIENNMVHEIGIWEKQSSMWFQAQTCQTRLRNNIFFNGPRAAVNVNDGFGGDMQMSGNLLINTCRESGDHGPWNSWDRVPYITEVAGNGPSIIPAYNQIHNNFIIGTYQTQSGVDTDDGSSYYKMFDNFWMYGDFALKSDFGGHDSRQYNNIFAYIDTWYLNCCVSGFRNWFESNHFITNNNKGYTSNCDLPEGSTEMQIYNNSIYIPSGSLRVCGMSFAQWQAQGNDPGTTINALPSDQQVIAWARTKLANN